MVSFLPLEFIIFVLFPNLDPDVPKMNAPLPVFVQQAAAAKTIGLVHVCCFKSKTFYKHQCLTSSLLPIIFHWNYLDSSEPISADLMIQGHVH